MILSINARDAERPSRLGRQRDLTSEQNLARCLWGKDHAFATDAQTILLNWPVKGRRGTVPLVDMSTVHNGSQFVVASAVDSNPGVAAQDVDREMKACGDFLLPRAMRRHARLWSDREYRDSVLRGLPGFFGSEDLAAGGRLKLPGQSARVQGNAFMYAHVMLLKKMAGNSFRRASFCMDSDSSLSAAFCALSVELIKAGRVDVIEVSFAKGLTNDGRSTLAKHGNDMLQALYRQHRTEIGLMKEAYPSLNRKQVLIAHQMKSKFSDAVEDRGFTLASKGISWPFHTKGGAPEDTAD